MNASRWIQDALMREHQPLHPILDVSLERSAWLGLVFPDVFYDLHA